MRLYHGSKSIVSNPVYHGGKETNDYGYGFYCTEHLELAKEWACQENNNGFANTYELDISDLSILKLKNPEYHILNWLAILLENRKFDIRGPIPNSAKQYILREFLPEYRSYDVIIGYRADDSYFSFAKDFVNNTISLQQLNKAMCLGELGEQVVLISKKSFEKIHYIDHLFVDGSEYFKKYKDRDTKAREDYEEESKKDLEPDAITALDIVRGGIKNEDIFSLL